MSRPARVLDAVVRVDGASVARRHRFGARLFAPAQRDMDAGSRSRSLDGHAVEWVLDLP